MASYNTQTTYNRTYEKKVIEEAPRVRIGSPMRIGSPFTTSTIIPPTSFAPIFPTVTIPGTTQHSTFSSSSSKYVSSSAGSVRSSDNTIEIVLQMGDYKPEELKVSVIGQQIVVEAAHPEKDDDLGTVERRIVRKFPLPNSCPPEAVVSNLTAEGTLTISAVAPKQKEFSPSRSIPIKIVPGSTPASSAQPSPNPPHQAQSTSAEAPQPQQ